MTGRKATRRVEYPVSAGGVAYRQVNGRVEVVLCGRAMSGSTGSGGSGNGDLGTGKRGEEVRWSLAKGTPDPGETLEETALREVREETGMEVEIDAPIGAIDYWFVGREPDVRFHKTVHFYLMVAVGGDIQLHDPEFDVVQWFSLDTALGALAYPNEAGIMRRALQMISDRYGDT